MLAQSHAATLSVPQFKSPTLASLAIEKLYFSSKKGNLLLASQEIGTDEQENKEITYCSKFVDSVLVETFTVFSRLELF